MLGLEQPDVSALITGRDGKFSIDRLVRCLDRMDYKVDVVVRHKPRRASSRAIAAQVQGIDKFDIWLRGIERRQRCQGECRS
jgi:hypothetical protein